MKVFSLVSTARRWSASASAARDVTFSLGARDIFKAQGVGGLFRRMAIVGGSRPGGGGQGVRETLHAYAYGHRGTSARPSSTTHSTWRLQRRWATGRGRAGRTGTWTTRLSRLQQGHRVPHAMTGDCKGGGRPGGGGQGVRKPRNLPLVLERVRQSRRLLRSTTCLGNIAEACTHAVPRSAQHGCRPHP